MCKMKVAWEIGKSYPEVSYYIIINGDFPSKKFANLAFSIIERFTALMHKN